MIDRVLFVMLGIGLMIIIVIRGPGVIYETND